MTHELQKLVKCGDAYVAKAEAQNQIRFRYKVVRKISLHCTSSGKMLLAIQKISGLWNLSQM